MSLPETRESLLLRVRNPENREAWDEFSAIYRPVILRLAAQKGMQRTDSEDLAQQVLWNISKAIETWEPDSERARFRTWLRKVADNAIINALTRQRPDQATGGEQSLALQTAESNEPDSNLLKAEYRREVFVRVAKLIRCEFSEETWASFWKSTVDGRDIDSVAKELGRSRGSVYASRSRVMKRLRQKVEEYDDS